MTYYKWLLPNRRTPVQNVKWPVRVKTWTKPEKLLVVCESGWHGVERKDILAHLPHVDGSELWEVEVRGNIVHGSDKFSAESMRLVKKILVPDKKNLRLFACDVAQDVLWIYEKRYPGDTRVAECIEVARRFAMGQATEEEMTAAYAAAASYANAAYAAYGAGDAASYAAYAAANAASYAAAYANAASNAAYAAAYAAANAAAYAAASKYNDMFLDRFGL